MNIKKKMQIGLVFVLMFFFFSTPSLFSTPSYDDPNQPYDKIPGTWETPHIKWLNPLYGGKLRVLFIIPYINAREVVELSQRIEMEYTVIMNCGRQTWAQGGYEGGNATPLKGIEAKKVLRDLSLSRLSMGHHYDVIVIGNVSWVTIPEEVRGLILQHVERGTGLVSVSPNRLEEVIYDGLHIISGRMGKKAEGEDPLFETLFRSDEDTAVFNSIISKIPVDIMPVVVLKSPDEFSRIKELDKGKKLWGSDLREQAPLYINVSHYGKGRVVGLHYFDEELYTRNRNSSLTPQVRYREFSYDYFHALLALCLLQTAGREPVASAGLEFLFPPTDLKPAIDTEIMQYAWEYKAPVNVINRSDIGSGKIVLSAYQTDSRSQQGILDFNIRSLEGESIYQQNIPVMLEKDKKITYPVSIPVLSGGNYLADLKIKDSNGRTIDFISKSFCVVTDIGVTSIKTEKEIYADGETVKGEVIFSMPVTESQRAMIDVRDTWHRQVRVADVLLDEKRTKGSFSFIASNALSQIWDVNCLLCDEKGVVTKSKNWISIPNWEFNDFIWTQFTGTKPNYDWRGIFVAESLKRFGLNGINSELIHGRTAQFELAERMHMTNVYYAEHLGQRIIGYNDYNKEYSEDCLSEFSRMVRHIADTGQMLDPKEFPYRWNWMSAEWLNNSIKYRYLPSAKFGSPIYLLNSENELLGEMRELENSCFCPLCTERFREWCRQSFNNNISQLNAEWNTNFKDFGEVRGILLQEAVEKDQLPRWVSFRCFMRSEVFTRLHTDWTAMIKRFIPQAKTGEVAWDNFDYTMFKKEMTSCVAMTCPVLGNLKLELHQSFSGDTGFYMGPGNTLRFEPEFTSPLENERYPWHYLFLGCTGLITGMEIYDMLGGGNYLTADYSEPLPFFKNISAEIGFLNKGITTLVSTSVPERSKVAILWTPYNHYISRLFPFEENKFSSGNTVVTGGAHEDCLIMMNSLRIRPTYIGDKDIADGILEKEGYRALILPYNKGMKKIEAENIRKFVKAGGLVIADNTPGICSEHGKVQGVPLLNDLFPVTDHKNIVHFGRGVAAYLPGEINGYYSRSENCNYIGSDSVAALLKEYAGIEPSIQLVDSRGMPRRDTQMRVFKKGTALYVGMLRNIVSKDKEPDATTVKLPRRYHIWDVRKQRYMGFTDTFEITLDHYPHFYALLPAYPSMMKIVSAKNSVRQGDVQEINGEISFFKGEGISDIGQVVHIEVYGPSGKPLEYYRKNKGYSGEKFSIELPVSFSEQPGRYTVEVSCPVTGLKAGTCFDVVR